MRLVAYDGAEAPLLDRTYFSTGGGFVASKRQLEKPTKDDRVKAGNPVPFRFTSAAELLDMCAENNFAVHELILANEDAMRPREKTRAGIDSVAKAMDDCIDRGLTQTGILPGGLKVRRRAPELWGKLDASPQSNEREQLFDWLNCFAMAVNEENAAGGKVVTAPTNGAAGSLPSVMRF
jgi:L-serine dehydratase